MKSRYATISARQPRQSHLKVHVVWVPKYRKRVLAGPLAVRTRGLLRRIVTENDLDVISGKVAADHVPMFISYRAHQNISQIVQWLKGTSSRLLFQDFPHLKKQYWGRHLWARGYCAVTSGNITDEMINDYISEQEGVPVRDDRRFQIDPS
ncbi:MAG: IS200/IS605 family transposase [Beijerinckiaceae bacterium]